MASIYKRKLDKGKRRAYWYFNYLDATGKRRTRRGFTDKRKTEPLATGVEYTELQRQFEGVDLEAERLLAERTKPILEHVQDYEKSLVKRTSKYRKLLISRLKLMISRAQIGFMPEMTIATVEMAIGDICTEKDSGHQTYNHYVDACSAFGKWMARKAKRITVNPLDGIEKLNVQEDIRHPRRALTADEFSRLVQSARSSGVSIQCYDGETRARIYIMSYLTGLRRKELASLAPASFSLTGEQPTMTLEAAHSKHRCKDTLPLHVELVRMLGDWLSDMDQDELLFPKLAIRRTWLMVKLDLERAGIEYRTADGIADFHAAGRHTYITELLLNGASLVATRELARHSDIKMTMKYTHIGVEDQAKALQKIPAKGLVETSEPAAPEQPEKSWEYPGSSTGDVNGHELARYDNQGVSDPNDATPVIDKGCHRFSSSDNDFQEWRRRESNLH